MGEYKLVEYGQCYELVNPDDKVICTITKGTYEETNLLDLIKQQYNNPRQERG